MFRTILIVIGLIAAVLWLPLWVQLILLSVALFVTPYRLGLFVPAIISDVLYAPTSSILHFKMTAIVACLLVVWWIIMHRTRLGERYA